MAEKLLLEDVYKTSGVPTHTFVAPVEYSRLKVFLRTKGRGLIIEGPSGIGKTTSIVKALEEFNITDSITQLSARKRKDVEEIKTIPDYKYTGIIIVDDFHRLEDQTKNDLADFMKSLADEEEDKIKLILIGINNAGESLIKFAGDLNNRIDTVKFEKNPEHKVQELIDKGEKALNISLSIKEDIINLSEGSFHIAQLLCKETCIIDGTTEEQVESKDITISIGIVKEHVLYELSRTFYEPARSFAVGSKLRPEGRAPYLHLLKWLSESDEWSIRMNDVMSAHPEHKASINQVVEKRFLDKVVGEIESIQTVLHYDSVSRILSVEDPKFLFYIKNIAWNKFTKQIGFSRIKFKTKYDIALSFAGTQRDIAKSLFEKLTESEIHVFYDNNEQHRIIAENVEEYLAPIYSSEAMYVVALMSNEYPNRIWTKFESEHFKKRFGEKSVIPIWFSDANPGMFDESRKYGGLSYDTSGNMEEQTTAIAALICQKFIENESIEDPEEDTE